jgi:UDPglucose 6-dehydrogenase
MKNEKVGFKISIIGGGYVGMSLGGLLAKKYHVSILDIDTVVVDKINNQISPIKDKDLEDYLLDKNLNISATSLPEDSLKASEIVIIATPTNFNHSTNAFDTDSVESAVFEAIKYSPQGLIVIKSTVPVGFTKTLQAQYPKANIIFSPEFLREGQALKDNLCPSRIVIGGSEEDGKIFATILQECSSMKTVPIVYMDSSAAEAVKLFSNAYLAMRVGFFNELDSFALTKKLNAKDIIKGVCLDERIGDFYNNPSFGYGGYCLPKDTQQLLSSFDETPQQLIQATITANQARKSFIASHIIACKPKVVGIYKLSMKAGSDNHRSSAVLDIISELTQNEIKVIIFEPTVSKDSVFGCAVIKELNLFIDLSSVIIANRIDEHIGIAADKIFTRDIFRNN